MLSTVLFVSPIRVELVCDQQMLADALRIRLAREPEGFVLSHRCSRDEGLVDAVRARQPDLLLVDARSVCGHWANLVDTLVEAAPRARVAVMSDTTDSEDAANAARRCLSAWLHPRVTADHLVDVLRVIADGHTVYPSIVLGDVLRRFAAELRDPASGGGPLARLTDRERQVLTGLVKGWRGREIADNLDLSENTVRTHTTRIFRKLGVHNRLEALRIARRSGFELWAPGAAETPSRPVPPRRHPGGTRLITERRRPSPGRRADPPSEHGG